MPSFAEGAWSAAVDEAGRGALAGPLVVAAVAASAPVDLLVRDSKKLSPSRRDTLFAALTDLAAAGELRIGVGVVPPEQIDVDGMAHALAVGVHTAVADLEVVPAELWVDGPTDLVAAVEGPATLLQRRCEPRLDDTDMLCAAASIVAKVSRDRLMVALDDIYPGYGFASHKGYGTASHATAIARLGRCAAHRWSWTVRGVCDPQPRP